ncbi:hypothetical protein N9Z18_00400 [Verrucomicrobiales bacterium]|nr:hypothetical protein [Verrucomicrobiales bacterium]
MKTSVICILTLLATSLLPAQGPKGRDSGPLPLQGEMLSEVSAFNEEGVEVQLQQLFKGRHAVIVFGCLT